MVELNEGFPQTYNNFKVEDLLKIYKLGPERLRKAAEGLSIDEMRNRALINKWSIEEILIHTVDSEIMGYSRFMQTITQSDRKFAFYSQNIWTEVLNYNLFPKELIECRFILFESLRKSIAYVLENLNENEWEKKGVHPEMGEITLKNILELYTDHCERHIEQILVRRKILRGD